MLHLNHKKRKKNTENLKNIQENNGIKRLLLTGTHLKSWDWGNQHIAVIPEEPITTYET